MAAFQLVFVYVEKEMILVLTIKNISKEGKKVYIFKNIFKSIFLKLVWHSGTS